MNTTISMINSESRVWSRWTPSLTNRPLTQGAPNTQIKIRYQDHWEENDDDFEIKHYVNVTVGVVIRFVQRLVKVYNKI